MIYAVAVLVIAVLIAIGNNSQRKYPQGVAGARLQANFRKLGNMTGKSRQQVVAAVGAPSTVSYIGRAQMLQWQAPGYHISMRFDERDMFAGITHEHASGR